MRLRLPAWLVSSVLAMLVTSFGHASAASTNDPLGCAATVFDPADHVDDLAVAEYVRSAEGVLGADVRVRVETAIDGGMDARIDQLIAQCAGWSEAPGELDDDRIVVMFSPTEREAALYYGGDHADVLEKGWESIVDAMTARLEVNDFNGTVRAALTRLETVSSDSTTNSSAGSDFPIGWVLLLVVIAAAVATYEAFKRSNGGNAGGGEDSSSWFRRFIGRSPDANVVTATTECGG